MRTVLILNAHSRQAGSMVKQVRTDFETSPGPFDIIDVLVIRKLGSLPKILRKLSSYKKLECVIVGSGDGTIVAVLNAMKNRPDVVFGFLPLGTLNAFVRSLGVPAEYEAAFKQLKKGRVRRASLGEVNGIRFANIIAIGISARMSGTISDKTKRLLGPLAYAFASLKILVRHRAFRLTVETDGVKRTFRTHQAVIANGHFHGDKPISKEASAYKDKLVLTIFGSSPKRRHYLGSIIRFRLTRHEDHDKTELIPFANARLITKPRRNIEVDGEILARTPVDVNILPRAIKVLG